TQFTAGARCAASADRVDFATRSATIRCRSAADRPMSADRVGSYPQAVIENRTDGVTVHARHMARTVLWTAGTVLVVGICMMNTVLALFGLPGAFDGDPAAQDAVMTSAGALAVIAGALSAVTVFWRRRL